MFDFFVCNEYHLNRLSSLGVKANQLHKETDGRTKLKKSTIGKLLCPCLDAIFRITNQ